MIAPHRLLSAVILSALVGIVLGVPSAAAQQAPNMPDPPSVVAKSKTVLTVRWTAPTGPAVASYDVQYRKSTEMNWTDGPQDQTRPRADITGLDADTFYDVQVRATNAEGDSGWSDDAQGATALFEADLTVGRHSDGGFTHQVGYRRGHPAASSNLYPPDEMGHGMLTSSELTYSGVTYTIDAIRRDNRENRLVIGYSSDARSWPRDWDITFFQTEEIEQFSTALINPDNQMQTGRLDEQANLGGILHSRPHIGAIWNWDRNNLPWTVDQTYSMTIARVQRADTTVTISADSPDVTLNPTSLTIRTGTGNVRGTITLTATLSAASSADTTVTISADPPDVTLSPDSLTIPAGDTEGTVTLTAILPQTNHPPVFPSPERRFSVDENTPPGQDIGILERAFDDGGERLTYTLDGPDAAAFDLFVANQFRTKAELDYETKDSYRFVVSVRDSRNDAGEADTETDDTIEVTITVVDLDEAGIVTLTGTPAQLREELTAALHDDDGRPSGITWQWARSGITWTDIDMATSERYTPEAGDLGKHLRATATYTDRYGSGKSASTTTTAVQAPPKVTLHLSPSSINEDGGQSTVTARLASASPAVTTVTVSAPAGDVTLSNNRTLTIAAGKTESTGTGTVTLTAVDNDGDGPETKQVQVSGQRNNPLATEPAPVTLTITDDDTAPTVTMVLPDAITENAGMGTLAVMLSHPSSAATAVEVSVDMAEAVTLRPNSLTISVTASADLPAPPDVTLRPNSLTIPAGETEDTVMLTATLSAVSSTDTTVTISVDPATVTLSPNSLTIPAGETEGTVTLTATLNAVLLSTDTTVTVSADLPAPPDPPDPPVVTLSPDSLTIPAGDTEGTGTLTATLSEASSEDTTVTVSADPAADVTLRPNPLTIPAGETEGTVTLTVMLSEASSADTTVTVSTTAVTLSPNPLIIPAEETAGSVTLTVILGEAASADTTVTVSADPAAVTLSPTSLTIPAGETEDTVMLTATLSAMSNTDTTVTVSTVSAAAVTLSPTSLTIPAGMTRGTVTLTAVDDNTDALNKRVIVSGLASNAHGIAGNPEPRTLRIQDDDPAPTVTLELAPNPIGENGGESTLTVGLDRPSSQATTVTVSADPAAVRLSPNSLTIPAGETAGTVTLTVTAKDNNIDGPETTTVTVSADAENRLGVTDPAGATLTIQDDDGPPMVTLAVSPNPIPENGGVSTLTARLDRPSSRPIMVTVAPDPAYTLDGNPTLTFPAGTTARQGTVVLTAKDNAIDAPDAPVSVGGTANPSLTVAAAELTITDNDTRGVMVSEHTLAIKEGGNPGTYTVVLASEPTSPVTIAVASSDAAVRVNPPSLGFTAANWQTAQTVTVDAANDEVENNPPKTATITHTVTGGDYEGESAASVAVTVTDDESPSTAVTLSVSPAAVREGAGNRTVTVTGELNGEPRSAPTVVTVSITAGTATAGTDFSVSNVSPLTILQGQPSGTATFVLTPENDTIDEPNETVTVGGSTTTVGLAVTETTLTIEDNGGPPAVELVLSANPISEDETTQVTATLSHPSSADTTVEVSVTAVHPASAGDFRLSGTSLTIPAGFMESSTSATLWARDNPVDEADAQVNVRGRAENPQGVQSPNVGPVTVTITDDDPPEVTGETLPKYVEGGSGPVATYTASNPANVRLTWSVIGTDARFFTIANGVLRFKQSPDYEDPLDKEYAVTVQASDRTDPAGTLEVTVAVLDALGKVELPPSQPQVEVAFTATLIDLDGLHPDPVPPNEERWCWQRSRFPTFLLDPGFNCLPITTDTYTPVDADLDHYLRVTVLYYTDGQETLKADIVVAATDEPVRATADEPMVPPEPVVAVSFNAASYTVDEGKAVEVTVRLSADPERRVEIPLTLTPGDNVEPSDYSGVPDSVVFESGNRAQSFSFSARADQRDEAAETLTLTFDVPLPTGVEVGSPATTVITINSNEGGGGGGGGGGSGGGGGGGGGPSTPAPPPEPVGYLENPGTAVPQSGIGVISGWVCEAAVVEIELNGVPQEAAYGTERLDTEAVCGDTDNGFGLLFNWNLLGDGVHEVVAFVDGVELTRTTVTVTTLGMEFLRDVTGTCEATDFPLAGEHVTLVWQQAQQNFSIADGAAPRGADRAGAIEGGYLENPGPNSFQSGIGVISGWVCEAETVEIVLNGEAQPAAYGTERLDTLDACGDTDNGFGLLFNWNLLGEGEHTVVARVDGEELGRATVRVTTLGTEFLRGVAGECEAEGFPMPGETVTLEWQQNSQNFVITDIE